MARARIGKFIRAAAGEGKMLPHLRRKFFSSISRPGFYTLQAGFVPRFRKGCWGNGRCKNTPTRTPRAVQSELYRDNLVTHIELCVCVCFSSSSKISPSLEEKKRKKRKSTRRAINRPRRPNPAYPALSLLVARVRRETRNVSLLNARRHAFRFTSYFRPRL